MQPLTNPEGRIAFRPLDGADLPDMQRWLADPDVAIWWREYDLTSMPWSVSTSR